MLVSHTIDDLYFWSNAVTLGLLVCAAGIIYFEWRSAAKKEIVAATIIAELWNGRVSDRIEIVRRTEQFNQLVELQNQETERLLSAGPKISEHEQEAAGSITKSVGQIGIRVHRLRARGKEYVPGPARNRIGSSGVTRMMVQRACNRATCCCNAGWRRSKTARRTSNKD